MSHSPARLARSRNQGGTGDLREHSIPVTGEQSVEVIVLSRGFRGAATGGSAGDRRFPRWWVSLPGRQAFGKLDPGAPRILDVGNPDVAARTRARPIDLGDAEAPETCQERVEVRHLEADVIE